MVDGQGYRPGSSLARRLPVSLRAPLAVLLLCALSLAVLRAPIRHVALPDQPALAAMSDLRGWHRTPVGAALLDGEPATLRLRAAGGRLVYGYRPQWPVAPGQTIGVSAELRGENLGGGHIAGGAGQLVAISLDQRRRRIAHWPYRVGALDGSSDWREVRLIVPASERIAGLQLVAFVAANSGVMELRNLRVEALRERTVFTFARLLLLALWCATWAASAWWLLRPGPRRLARALLALSATLALAAGLAPPPALNQFVKQALIGGQDALYEVAALLPAEQPTPAATHAGETPDGVAGSADIAQVPTTAVAAGQGAARADDTADAQTETGAIAESATTAAPRSYWMPPSENLDKRSHLVGFSMLGLLAVVAFGSRSAWRVLPAVAMLAVSIESLQGFTAMREPDVLDLGADLLGAVAGVLAAWLAGYAWRRFAGRRAVAS